MWSVLLAFFFDRWAPHSSIENFPMVDPLDFRSFQCDTLPGVTQHTHLYIPEMETTADQSRSYTKVQLLEAMNV